MTERRTTITLNWRPSGAPARRIDDCVEGASTRLTTRAITAGPVWMPPARRAGDIGVRLENWGTWANTGGSSGPGSNAGTIYENARRAGLVDEVPGASSAARVNTLDAECINTAFIALGEDHRQIIHWTYIAGMREGWIAARCQFPVCEYIQRLTDAQEAIETLAGPLQHSCTKLIDIRKSQQ